MADETASAAEAPKKKRLPKTAIIVVGVAVVEAGIFFGAIKLFGGGPQTTYGDEQHELKGEEADPNAGRAEIQILKRFKVPNTNSGRTFIYDFDVSVVIATGRLEFMSEVVRTRSGEIADRIAQIVRAADPRDLEQANLETIRFKFKNAISEIIEDDKLIQRVLIPRWVPMQAG